MRRLLPTPVPVDPGDVYAGLDPPSPWVALGMVTSLDGATAVGGTSGPLGGAGDLAAFRALRALADVVLVGLGTAIVEDYRPAWQPRHVEARARRGQQPLPRLALVTGSGTVPSDLRTLADPAHPPLVCTTPMGARTARARVGERAEVVEVAARPDGLVDPVALVGALTERGLTRVVCEGGPTLNHTLVEAGVVHELFVTVAPVLVGGGTGIVAGALAVAPQRLQLHELRIAGSELLCRYRLVRAVGR